MEVFFPVAYVGFPFIKLYDFSFLTVRVAIGPAQENPRVCGYLPVPYLSFVICLDL